MNPNDSQKTHSLQTPLQMADDQFNKATVKLVNKQSYISTIFQRPSRILFNNKSVPEQQTSLLSVQGLLVRPYYGL